MSNNSFTGHCQSLELLQCRDPSRVVPTDLDDTIGHRHLQDQVLIVDNDHELVQGWPA
jgi:hypothetical protein